MDLKKIIERLEKGDKLKDISKELQLPYQTLYHKLIRKGLMIPKNSLNELIAIYSYKHGTKEACYKFGITPQRLCTLRYNLRRKHKFKLLDKDLAKL